MSKIVLLAGRNKSTNIVFHALENKFNIDCVIIENPIPKIRFIKNRIKKLGFLTVIGQVLFLMIVVPILEFTSKRRINRIINQYNLDESPIDPSKVIYVESVNLDSTIDELSRIKPTVVLINGTRIISKKVLGSVNARFVNMHAGITPHYRGVHGGYWALVDRKPELCGVTIHMVDPGIDTGSILKQSVIQTTPEDNYSTYPMIQLGTGLSLLVNSLEELLKGQINLKSESADKSKLWSHPTLMQYIWNRFVRRVK